ncbi:MAG: hypothetical protein AAFS10_25805 [Myxococcota bacterium]
MRPSLSFAALMMVFGMGACTHVPERDPERALFLDLERIVSTRERTVEWVIDESEAEYALPTLLRSVCKVKPEGRLRLKQWLDTEIESHGGSAEALYLNNGRDLDKVSDLLRLERVRSMLVYAQARADKCPFWLHEQEHFAGIHSDARRIVLYLESNGGGWVVFRGGQTFAGGGGSARVSVGFGMSERLTLLLGAEFGGQGIVGGQEDEEDEQQVSANLVVGVPFVARFVDASRLYDIELAAIALTNPQTDLFQPGGRVLIGTGLATPRIGAFMPSAVFMMGYEYYPAASGLPVTHLVRIGTRVGVDFDP